MAPRPTGRSNASSRTTAAFRSADPNAAREPHGDSLRPGRRTRSGHPCGGRSGWVAPRSPIWAYAVGSRKSMAGPPSLALPRKAKSFRHLESTHLESRSATPALDPGGQMGCGPPGSPRPERSTRRRSCSFWRPSHWNCSHCDEIRLASLVPVPRPRIHDKKAFATPRRGARRTCPARGRDRRARPPLSRRGCADDFGRRI